MAYMRGKNYVYSDGKYVHFYGEGSKGGSAEIEEKLLDSYVVMRYARLVKELGEKKLVKFEKETLDEFYGNFGCDALAQKFGFDDVMTICEKTIKELRKKSDGRKVTKRKA